MPRHYVKGFTEVISQLKEKPVAISFAFPGPATTARALSAVTCRTSLASATVWALGPFLSAKFGLPVFINNDGDLFTYGEATGGALPEINRRIKELGGSRQYANLLGYTFGTGLGIGSVINGRLKPRQ